MDERRDLLLRTAARLYSLGVDLDAAKEHIRDLVDAGTAYDAPEMQKAAKDYTMQKELWDSLEAEYLKLKRKILTE